MIHLGKKFSKFLKMKSPCHPAIPLQGDIEEKLKHNPHKSCTCSVISELLKLENEYS